ncbi:potassium channel family protein [Sphingomicrobium sediminis]|uniref:Potassium channel family protein n=1 Tax=Sphingomicrobium sediminis TaxID=2950949 RepID=A0A9X2EFR0_9SPHN|nr:potassium channel family protein [Sphingomicrobium sediminis]MCM8557160.1 potassium channel family protein [Sphingomicrobium sediminis]
MERKPRLGSQIPLLRQKSPLSGWAQFGIRVGLLFALLAFIVAVHWIDRESFVDSVDGEISFADVIYFTMISATTTGYGDIVPVTEEARLFDALVVTPARIFFILILAGTAYTFVIKRTWDTYLMRRLQRTLSGHIVVAGYGTSGGEAVDELIARGEDPRKIVVIDQNPESIAKAERLGCIVLQADATRDETMEAVRLRQANTMIISAGRDDTSILICLTARHLCPKLHISLAVRAEDNEFPARAAGATTVINPTSFAGLLLAGSAHGAGIADYLADLASATGRVRLHEREIENFEIGKPLSEVAIGLGVRILRNNKAIGFWEEGAKKLETGDRIIEIIPGFAFPPCN